MDVACRTLSNVLWMAVACRTLSNVLWMDVACRTLSNVLWMDVACRTLSNVLWMVIKRVVNGCGVSYFLRWWVETTLTSTSVSVCFRRGISRLGSASIFLRWFKLARICIQVCTLHSGCKQRIDQQIFNRKSISRKITHPQSWKLQAKLTGEKLKGWSNSREKTNSRLN